MRKNYRGLLGVAIGVSVALRPDPTAEVGQVDALAATLPYPVGKQITACPLGSNDRVTGVVTGATLGSNVPNLFNEPRISVRWDTYTETVFGSIPGKPPAGLEAKFIEAIRRNKIVPEPPRALQLMACRRKFEM